MSIVIVISIYYLLCCENVCIYYIDIYIGIFGECYYKNIDQKNKRDKIIMRIRIHQKIKKKIKLIIFKNLSMSTVNRALTSVRSSFISVSPLTDRYHHLCYQLFCWTRTLFQTNESLF